MKDTYAIVGAGFSGAVLARQLAEAGHPCAVFERRAHIAGNCHTERDPETGIMVHRYGPHIFHTDDNGVWAFVGRFGAMRPYRNRVKATVGGHVYSLPINLHTINQFFGTALTPTQAEDFIAAQRLDIAPTNFETSALASVGPSLYDAFFKGYTGKQWGCPPAEIPASVLKRLPLRFTYDDDYFPDKHQGIPELGYTALVAAILDHPQITVHLGTPFSAKDIDHWRHVFWTGRIDGFFDYCDGELSYRTTDFAADRAKGDIQGCAVMNHPDPATAHVRSTEFKHLTPWETHDQSIVFREYPRDCGPNDEPMYPIRSPQDKATLARYIDRAHVTPKVTFAGRLGTYRYLDMDDTIRESLDLSAAILSGAPAPCFSAAPL